MAHVYNRVHDVYYQEYVNQLNNAQVNAANMQQYANQLAANQQQLSQTITNKTLTSPKADWTPVSLSSLSPSYHGRLTDEVTAPKPEPKTIAISRYKLMWTFHKIITSPIWVLDKMVALI